MSFFQGIGNPRYGRDPGPPPPGHGSLPGFLGGPTPQQNQSYPMAAGYPLAQGYQPAAQAYNPYQYGYPQQYQQAYPPPGYPPGYAPSAYGAAPGNVVGLFAHARGPNLGQALGGRPAQPYPNIDPTMPASNMTNSTGGVGCEPGYNYFFPSAHTKIHVLKSGATPPWRTPPNFAIPFHACHVPVDTTLRQLLKGFGANNADARRNVVTEVVQGGGGRWYSGMCFSADDDAAMAKTIKEVGWDETRTGHRGEKPVVYLYVQRG